MKRPVIAIFSDIHLSKDNFLQIEKYFQEFVKYVEENDIKIVIITGDVFTERIGQSLSVLLAFKNFLNKLCKIDAVYIIPGNHDKVDLNSNDSYLDVFYQQNLMIVREYLVVQKFGLLLCFLGFFGKVEDYINFLKRIVKKCEEIDLNHKMKWYLFTHISINGVMNNDGSIVEDGLKRKNFDNFDKVFCGHYHNSSMLSSKIYYFGSFIPHNFGEDNNKGVLLMDEKGDYELTKIFNFKKYIKKTIDVENTKKEEIFQLKQKYSNSKDNIRFVFVGTEDQLLNVDSKEYEEVGIEVKKCSVSSLRNIEFAEKGEFISYNKSLILKYFFEYCKEINIEIEKRRIGLKYLKDVDFK